MTLLGNSIAFIGVTFYDAILAKRLNEFYGIAEENIGYCFLV
jgi:hypothetical protein